MPGAAPGVSNSANLGQGPGVSSNFWQHRLYHIHLPLEGASVVIGEILRLCT